MRICLIFWFLLTGFLIFGLFKGRKESGTQKNYVSFLYGGVILEDMFQKVKNRFLPGFDPMNGKEDSPAEDFPEGQKKEGKASDISFPEETRKYRSEKKDSEKIRWLGIALWGTWIICSLSLFLAAPSQSEQIRSVERSETGEESSEYTWTVISEEGDPVSMNISVSSRSPDEAEWEELAEEAEKELKEKLCQEGDTPDSVTKDLYFPDTLAEGKIKVSWQTGDTLRVSRTGTVNRTGLSGEGEVVRITAVLSCGEWKEEVNVYVQVLPEEEPEESWEDKLKKYLEQLDSENLEEENFALPEEYEGQKIAFYEEKQGPGEGILLLFSCMSGILIYVLLSEKKKHREKKRKMQMQEDYPEILMKETVLLGAGMTSWGAWERIVRKYVREREKRGERYAYEEMMRTWNLILSGEPEGAAYLDFGRRCSLHCYMKMGSLLEQNVKTGSRGLVRALNEEAKDALREQKMAAKRKGEEAGTKLLAPMMMLLVVVMILIMMPAMQKISY